MTSNWRGILPELPLIVGQRFASSQGKNELPLGWRSDQAHHLRARLRRHLDHGRPHSACRARDKHSVSLSDPRHVHQGNPCGGKPGGDRRGLDVCQGGRRFPDERGGNDDLSRVAAEPCEPEDPVPGAQRM